MLVYVAVYGEYDDFGIEGVFQDRDKAIEAIKSAAFPNDRKVLVYNTENGKLTETIKVEDHNG